MSEQDLRKGDCYFLLTYHDEDLKLPSIATYVFVGKNIFKESRSKNGDRWFFQTAESQVKDGLFDPKIHRPGEQLLAAGQDMLDEFYDPGQLAEKLRDLSKRRGRS